jgi:murein DD-endopeptidase MepM/ murein hydrolase activator NlpD
MRLAVANWLRDIGAATDRWLRRGCAVVAFALAVAGYLVGLGPAQAGPLQDRLAAVDGAEAMVRDKHDRLVARHRAQVRALYKAFRARPARRIADTNQRLQDWRRQSAVQRIVSRDLAELRILRRELAAVVAARVRLFAEMDRPARPAGPAELALRPPVAGLVVAPFGPYRSPTSRAELLRRGLEFAARPGEMVAAPQAGVVRYAGPLRGHGQAVVIEGKSGLRTVLGGLAELQIGRGSTVAAGQVVGAAAGPRVYLEARVAAGAGGLPIDPAPFLGSHHFWAAKTKASPGTQTSFPHMSAGPQTAE